MYLQTNLYFKITILYNSYTIVKWFYNLHQIHTESVSSWCKQCSSTVVLVNNCDTYFMIMRIFLALRRHGRVIDGDNWLRNPPHPEDKPTLFLHITYSCLPAVGSCIMLASFFFLVYKHTYIDITQLVELRCRSCSSLIGCHHRPRVESTNSSRWLYGDATSSPSSRPVVSEAQCHFWRFLLWFEIRMWLQKFRQIMSV